MENRTPTNKLSIKQLIGNTKKPILDSYNEYSLKKLI